MHHYETREPTVRLALAGDTMLGRGVAERLRTEPPEALIAPEVVEIARSADLFVLNLECAISDRGARWPDPDKPFFFRAPPTATGFLSLLGVDCVSLANNHALDYGPVALLDTLHHLGAADVAAVGAGPDQRSARRPVVLDHDGTSLGIVAVTDHPADYAAGADRPGVAYADLRRGDHGWLLDAVGELETDTDIVLVFPHWGPNMVTSPVPHVEVAARSLRAAGATLVAGHSAHVFHGVRDHVLFDLGDFIDDYAVHPGLRNDLGLLFFVDLDGARPVRLEAVPLALDFCRTRLAVPHEARWIAERFQRACADLGTQVAQERDRLVIDLEPSR